jgi:hypothetical protein
MTGFDWEVRTLLNKEDAVGKVHQKPPHIFVISDDFGRQKDLGILRAVQRFRDSGMKVIALFEDADSAREHADLCDSALAPPWKTAEVRAILSALYVEKTGEQPNVADENDEEAED